jgi:hypothetical protein
MSNTATKQMTAKQFATENGVQTLCGLAFKTIEHANQFAAIRCASWGDNLVYLGAVETGGLFLPEFNVFD